MKRGTFEARLLVLVTLGLVAFGLVMVYSATSAPAALGGGNPMGYLERQGTYAVLGLALMMVGARFGVSLRQESANDVGALCVFDDRMGDQVRRPDAVLLEERVQPGQRVDVLERLPAPAVGRTIHRLMR